MGVRLLSIILAFLSVAALASSSDVSALCRESETLFNQGNDLAGSNHEAAVECWRKAAARLELASEEISNAPLFYNLGNIYFRLGDMGRAILNYRKAQRFEPNDPNLLRNLSFARRSCQDNVKEQERVKVLKTLFFWHYDFSWHGREMVFMVFFAAAFAFAILRLRLKKSWVVWAVSLSAFIALLTAVSLGVSEWTSRKHRDGVIISAEVIGRKGNSESYEESFQKPLHAGTEFVLLESRGNWLEIQLADGQTCWIPRADAGLVR